MMAGTPQPVSPADIARVDQIAAELAEIVADARRHMAGCQTVPAGICIGLATTTRLRLLTCRGRYELLEEAVAQLARVEPSTGPGS